MALASINGVGWSAEYSGTPPAFAPDTAPETVSVSRQGYDATGAVTAYVEALTLTKRVRQPYPNQASLTATTVSLSDYVYSTDTITGVTNNSTETSPKPIAQWLQSDRRIVANSIAVELFAVHRNARGQKPVAAVVFTATDGTTTVSQTVSALSISTAAADQCPVLAYKAVLDITSLADNADITVNAKVYPWIGGAGSVADSSAVAVDSTGFCAQLYRKNTARAAAPLYCYVDATSGSDSTGVASATAATAAASPVATIGGAWVKLRALIGGPTVDGCEVRLKAGTHVFGAGNVFNTYQSKAENLITRDPAATRASVILQFGSANLGYDNVNWVRVEDVTIQRTGLYAFNVSKAVWRNVDYTGGSYGFKAFSGKAYIEGGMTASGLASDFAATTGQKIGLFRGVATSGSTFMLDAAAVFGCSFAIAPGFGWVAGRRDGTMTCFNKIMGATSEVWSPGGAAFVGAALIQNVMEWTSTGITVSFGPSRDSDTGTISHLCVWHNTILGANGAGRSNILYDDGPNGNLRTHKLQSFVGNIQAQINVKNDWFAGANTGLADASSHIGNWAYTHGVGCRGEVSLYQDAGPGLPQYRQDYPGLKASIGTNSVTPNGVNFVTYGAVTYNGSTYTAGAGGSNARLTGTSNAAYSRIPVGTGVLPFDLFGRGRRADDAAAAGAYENEQPRSMIAAPGSFVLTGSAAALTRVRSLAAPTGGFAVSGVAARLQRLSRMVATPGAFMLTGNPAELSYIDAGIFDPITDRGPIVAGADRTIAPTVVPSGVSRLTESSSAYGWAAIFDPADRAPYAFDWSDLLDDGEEIESIQDIRMSAAGAALGVEIDTSPGRTPIIGTDGKHAQLWFLVDPDFRDNAAFSDAGVQVAVTMRVRSTATPFKEFERTGNLPVRQL